MVTIGSKRPDAKEIKVTITKKQMYIFAIFCVGFILFWSLFINVDKIVCDNGESYKIEEGLTYACGIFLPDNLTKEEIIEHLEFEKNREVNNIWQ